jgi:hypothetical protein
MTAALADRATGSGPVGVLDHAWTAIRSHHSDVSQVVLLVRQRPAGKRLSFGHFAAGAGN